MQYWMQLVWPLMVAECVFEFCLFKGEWWFWPGRKWISVVAVCFILTSKSKSVPKVSQWGDVKNKDQRSQLTGSATVCAACNVTFWSLLEGYIGPAKCAGRRAGSDIIDNVVEVTEGLSCQESSGLGWSWDQEQSRQQRHVSKTAAAETDKRGQG